MTVEKRSPLAPLASELHAAGSPDVTLREVPFLAQVNLRIDPADGAALSAVRATLGFPLPLAPNTVSSSADRRAVWLGPDEWLIVADAGEEAALERGLRSALEGRFASVVDVSANRTTLELAGPRSRDVLQRGCALDLHPRAFGPGRCAQTVLARAQVVLEQRTAEPVYHALVRPSFAAYLAAWLMDAMAEFAGAAVADGAAAVAG